MRPLDLDTVSRTLAGARADGRSLLLETEGMRIAVALGFEVPDHLWVQEAHQVARAGLHGLTGPTVVVKVVSPEIVHKSDIGGVQVVPNNRAAVSRAIHEMQERFEGLDVRGYLLCRYVPHDRGLGSELLVGARWTDDFGPVVTFGVGGVYTEYLAEHLAPGTDVAILSPHLRPRGGLQAVLGSKLLTPVLAGQVREQARLLGEKRLTSVLCRMLELAGRCMPSEIAEFEINPLVPAGGFPVALDVLVRLATRTPATPRARPAHKIRSILQPRSIAIAGVSSRVNPGRVILKNILRMGFPPERIHVVKPACDTIDGCRCHPDVASLPEPVDLFIVSLEASTVPALLEEIVACRAAEGVVLIPGGIGERAGTEKIETAIRSILDRARDRDGGGPVLNGGNCLGVRSLPGRVDTLFIPDYKIPDVNRPASPVALISQSGAFAVTRLSSLAELNPRHVVTVGNQTDLTVGDWLTYLADDPEVRVFACYVEGFRPLDGLQWMDAAQRIVDGGRTVILYRAGRTETGVRATASHTASLAGEYAVTRELAREAGVLLADSIEDFDELIRLAVHLDRKPPRGWRLGAVSNAGFECVALADRVGAFRLARLRPATRQRLDGILRQGRVAGVVAVTNPLDLTPILGDAAYEAAVEAVLEDPGVDVAVIGCVPLTGALSTLTADRERHGENVARSDGVARRLAVCLSASPKPSVVVIDGGRPYDAMAALLARAGVPVFRSMDRAVRLLEIWCRGHVARDNRRRGRHVALAVGH